MSNVLEVRDVCQSFRVGFWMKSHEVLSGIHMDVPRGSIYGFLGANGAGKTTLIHLITGLKKPTSGQVLLAGFDAGSPEARARIGYLPERPYFHDHLTGEGMLRYFGALAGMDSSAIEARIPLVLEQVGIADARRRELRRYSKGMLQRIGIAQALLHEPEFLVLDEPMSGLDPFGRKEIRDLIKRIASDGRTIFFSSHVIPDVEAICDHVALIQRGRLIGAGPIGSFLSKGLSKVEVAFEGIALEKARTWDGMSDVRTSRDGVRVLIEAKDSQSAQAAMNSVVQRVISSGGQLQWAIPLQPSLEDLFGDTLYSKEGQTR